MHVETIRIQNGRVRNIAYHNARCNTTRQDIYGAKDVIDLRKSITHTPSITSKTIKCRVLYTDRIEGIQYTPYYIKPIENLRCIVDEDITYKYKSTDRHHLTKLYAQRGSCDDILIVQKGLITDTYYANVALLHNSVWYTPESPLLRGTARARLLEKGRIQTRSIHIEEISDYDKLCIFNAMIPFQSIVIDTKKVCF